METSGRPVSQFVNLLGASTRLSVIFPVDPVKVRSVRFPPFGRLPVDVPLVTPGALRALGDAAAVPSAQIPLPGAYARQPAMGADPVERLGLAVEHVLEQRQQERRDDEDECDRARVAPQLAQHLGPVAAT